MSIATRTCANCTAFNPVRAIDEPGCLNLVSFIVSADRSRDPGPTDACDLHQTHQEDAAQTAYIEVNREAIMGGIKATVVTQELMGKLRGVQ